MHCSLNPGVKSAREKKFVSKRTETGEKAPTDLQVR